MKTKTYTAGKDLILHEGEIMLTSQQQYPRTGNEIRGIGIVTHSTSALDGIIKLNRQQFFKGVDVQQLADEALKAV